MGRKKKSSSTSTKGQTTYNKNKKRINIDMAVISLFIISILLFVLIYAEKGAIGEILSPVLGGIIGWIKYLIPVGTLALSVCIAREDRNYLSSKVFQYLILIGCIAATLSIYQISVGNISIDLEFNDVIEMSYDLGVKNIGGGTVGTVIAYPLVKLFGMFGAAIVCVGMVVILCVFTFGLHPSELMIDVLDELNIRKEERERALEDRRNQRNANRVRDFDIGENDVKSTKVIDKSSKAPETAISTDEIQINLNGEPIDKTQDERPKKKGLFDFMKHSDEDKNDEMDPEVLGNIFKSNEPEPTFTTVKNGSLVDPNTKIEGVNLQETQGNTSNGNSEDIFTIKTVEKEDKTQAVLGIEHTQTTIDEDENYEVPPIELLSKSSKKVKAGAKGVLAEKATQLQRTLHSFGVSAKVENISVGPVITRFELKPAEGVRVSKIANLSDDIALNLAAESIRIEAPIPGKQAVGIEIPNKEKEMVPLRDVVDTEEFRSAKSKLSVALGKDVAGSVVLADIAKMPHVLIAGSTGSGKSVCINTIITSILYNTKPSEVKLLMIDPKVVELSVYNGIPHLLIPVVTDPKKAAGALNWAVQEMDDRYEKFAQKGVRDLKGYNAAVEKELASDDAIMSSGKLPQMVIIVDELADLMMVASKEVEESICRLAQKARACGMHLVIATQRPSVDVITGLIKANVPSRIAFAVSSQIDSRTILDQVGAEKLLGKGDMLYFPQGVSKPTRVQGAFVSDSEVEKIVDFIKSNGTATYSEDILESIENSNKTEGVMEQEQQDDDTDPFLMDAIDTCVEVGQASTSFIQRKFKVGYARAGRIIDQMEARGIISGYEGSKPRKVLITLEKLQEMKMAAANGAGGSNEPLQF